MLNTYRDIETANGDKITIETAFDDVSKSWTGKGWAACLNGFDLDVRSETGTTEEEAIQELLSQNDIELKDGVKALMESTTRKS